MSNENLRKARIHHGWTQARLAEMLDVQEQTVHSWEAGKRIPSITMRAKLVHIFGLSLAELGLPDEQQADRWFSESRIIDTVPDLSQENRQRMLQRVKSRWIEGVLNHSLYHKTLLTLGLREQPNAVENPWRLSIQETNLLPQKLPEGTSIIEVFDSVGGDLLILGEPGAGKTTLLLELARELLTRAENGRTSLIPVVFNLSSWAEKQRPLDEWLVEELNSKYQVPLMMGREWVQHDRLMLLLDGLDEVVEGARAGCISAISTFRKSHGLVPLVICSRFQDYFAQANRLLVRTAVTIEPLTQAQIESFLDRSKGKLAKIRKTIASDSVLREMVSTPFLLNVVIQVYEDENNEFLQGSLEKRKAAILEAYVDRVLQRRAVHHFSREQTIHYLTCLAKNLVRRNQTEFYIERMQANWLKDDQKKGYRLNILRCVVSIEATLVCMIFASFRGDVFPHSPGLFYWLGGSDGASTLGWMQQGLGGGFLGGASLGILICMMALLIELIVARGVDMFSFPKLLEALWNGFRISILVAPIIAIVCVLAFTFSGGLTYGLDRGIGATIFAALCLIITFGLITLFRLPNAQRGKIEEVSFRLKDRFISGLIFGLCGATGFLLIYAIQCWFVDQWTKTLISYTVIMFLYLFVVYGLGNGMELYRIPYEIHPSETVAWSWNNFPQRLRENAKKSLYIALFIFLVCSLLLSSISRYTYGIRYGIQFGIVFSLIAAAIAGIATLLTGMLRSSWTSNLRDTHLLMKPNQGIRLSAKNAVVAAILLGIIGGGFTGAVSAFAFYVSDVSKWYVLGMGLSLIFTITFAVQFFLYNGGIAIIEHYLLRSYLIRKGSIPLHFVEFLDYASECILLQKIGGGYIFVHRLLLEYFAQMQPDSK